MSVIATLNIGANGATSVAGSSRALSTVADRERFLALHRSAGAIVIGKNSATHESYSHGRAPIFILTRDLTFQINDGKFEIIHIVTGLSDAMREIVAHNPSPIIVEAGPNLLLPLIAAGCIDEVQISLSPIAGDAHFIDWREIMKDFEVVRDEMVDGTRLLQGRYQGDATHR